MSQEWTTALAEGVQNAGIGGSLSIVLLFRRETKKVFNPYSRAAQLQGLQKKLLELGFQYGLFHSQYTAHIAYLSH